MNSGSNTLEENLTCLQDSDLWRCAEGILYIHHKSYVGIGKSELQCWHRYQVLIRKLSFPVKQNNYHRCSDQHVVTKWQGNVK